MSELIQRVAKSVSQRRLLVRGQKFLVAVSGGVDSMVLLHALHSLAPEHRWRISVAHFNHRLRGRASEADEKLVRQTAAKLRLPFLGGRADVRALAAQSKLSVEMAARKLRHEFLAQAARDHGLSTMALAHHADDQVELFFLRLLRGAGGAGLAGMKWCSPSPADPDVSLVRPLLDCTKTDLLDYARASRIRFRDDASNFSTDFLRNRIRNELLPLLRMKYQPGLNQTVLRLMNIVGAEAEFVSAAADAFCDSRQEGSCHDSRFTIDALRGIAQSQPSSRLAGRKSRTGDELQPAPRGASQFEKLPVAVQRQVLQQQLAALGLAADFELVEQLRAAPGKAVSVGACLTVLRDAAGMVSRAQPSARGFNPAELCLRLNGKQGSAGFGERKFHWRMALMKRFQWPRRQPARALPVMRERFDADQIGDEIILRHWRPGDRFQPIGLRTPVKLQDLFVNARIPAARRRELVLAATGAGAIFWVEGLRIGEQFKLTPQTRQILVWQVVSRRPETEATKNS